MSIKEKFQEWFEYEIDCNAKMLNMLESVPQENRGDSRFQQAVATADHLAACREKWLAYMTGKEANHIPWRNEACDLSTLGPRFAETAKAWTHYLANIEESKLNEDFHFTEANGETYSEPTEVQIVQLFGHASYHRGQIALLVDQLGGETEDTDYVEWWWIKNRGSY